ncbi:FecR family protein [Phenylobacterium sp.]|uniref:FecR family protein n=1 Tax=Phenylobacterium sp. TaxID=1871053 RepID=UPI002C5E0579|nr:FecR domain-containing protein [Phenylobacterium sp.]HVI33750.1 FecR domain-containing protein [Phenylobacterium sp.]
MSDRRDRARSEAAAWFARLGRQAVTTDALRAFRDWRRTPANAQAYAEVERTWAKAGTLAQDPEIRAATHAALDRRPRSRTAGLPRGPLAWGAAGLAALALAAALRFGPGLAAPAYDTGVGEQRLVVLEDGSRVRLNTDSRVRIRFHDDRRRVELVRGQAFFEVAHDPARPFTVDAGAADVRALGTRFDVRRLDGTVQVTLVEGSVRVQADAARADDETHAAWTLAPGQQLTVAPGRAAAPRPADTAGATSWTTGRIVFRETPLAAAVAEVNRYAPHKISLEAPALAAAPVNGVFDTGDTEAFVAAASSLFGLEARRAPDGAVVLKAPAG